MNIYVSIILRDHYGRFLVLFCEHKKEHQWRFPAGKVERGETFIEAAARELREETGVEALSLTFHSVHSDFVDGDHWTGYYFLCDRYLGQPAVQEPEKHTGMLFMTHGALVASEAAAAELAITKEMTLITAGIAPYRHFAEEQYHGPVVSRGHDKPAAIKQGDGDPVNE